MREARSASEAGVAVVKGWVGWGRVVVSMERLRRSSRPGMWEIVARERVDHGLRLRTSHQKCDCMPRPVGRVRWRTRLMG